MIGVLQTLLGCRKGCRGHLLVAGPPPTHPPLVHPLLPQIPAALAVLSLLTFNPMGVIVFGPVAALAALCFYWWRDQIDLATRLLGVAAHGLAANTGVITTTFLLNIASMVVISPLAVFIGEQRAEPR
jgi:hypothetical protein